MSDNRVTKQVYGGEIVGRRPKENTYNYTNCIAYKDTLPEQVNARTCQYLIFPLPVTVVFLYEVLHHCKVAKACCMSESTVVILFEVQGRAYVHHHHYQATHSSNAHHHHH